MSSQLLEPREAGDHRSLSPWHAVLLFLPFLELPPGRLRLQLDPLPLCLLFTGFKEPAWPSVWPLGVVLGVLSKDCPANFTVSFSAKTDSRDGEYHRERLIIREQSLLCRCLKRSRVWHLKLHLLVVWQYLKYS